jgi:hypothetical protein
VKRKSKEFLELQAQWYEKLAQSGFEDCETLKKGEWYLKKTSAQLKYKVSHMQVEAKVEFYNVIQNKMNEQPIRDPIDLEILTLYSQGVSQKKIREMLSVKLHRSTIYERLTRWLRRWKLKR